MGGLARKATIIENTKSDSTPILILDSGDLFFSKNKLVFETDNIETAKIRSEIIVESFNIMGCNGFSPGSRDFALGVSYLNKLKDISNFEFISCNLFNSITSKRLFSEFKIEKINGYDIAFIGAVSTFQTDSVLVKEPILAIEETVKKVTALSDFVILLFNGSNSDLNRLQKTSMNIDLILRSKGTSRTSENGGREKYPVYSSGNKGKYLSKINISKKEPNVNFVDLSLEKTNIKLSNKRLNNKKKGDPNANFEELYKDNQKILDDIHYHQNKIKESEEKILNAVNTVESHKIPLNSTIESKVTVLKIVDEGMARIPQQGPPLNAKPLNTKDHHNHDHN